MNHKKFGDHREWQILETSDPEAATTSVYIDREDRKVFIESFGEELILTFSQVSRLDGMIHPVKRRTGSCDNTKQVVPAPNPHGDDDHSTEMRGETDEYFSNLL